MAHRLKTADRTSAPVRGRLDILETMGNRPDADAIFRKLNGFEYGSPEHHAFMERCSISGEDVARLMRASGETLRERKARLGKGDDYSMAKQRRWKKQGRRGLAALEVVWAITGVWIV